MVSDRAFIYAVIIIAVFAGVTFLLDLYAKKRITKYIPGTIPGIGAISCVIKAFYFSRYLESIGFMLLAIALAIAFGASIMAALVIEFINFKNKHL